MAAAILRHWIAVFGPMGRLCHDQGREFSNKILADLLAWLQIQQRTTSAMAPSVNGEAEIFNKWIAAYLKTISPAPATDWEGHLAALNLAYNTAIHSAHRRQPAAVMFGRRFPLPHLDAANPADPATWAVQQKQHLQAAWAATRSALAGAADKMMHQQKNTRAFAPMQGERVLLFYPRTALAAKGPPKLQQQWREAAILAQLGPATYLARVRFSRLPSTMVHINRLKPFHPRIILPKEQWCQDPPAATAAQQSALSASQTACPLECPCRRCPCRFLNRKQLPIPIENF